ncbi:MAG: hypothetical protein HYS32_03935 [Candidatus Woesearchaeota archaeon]|nr:MAG: hypothetical protein HYS32_03935 [Candidatus Woesearchaeota archaeon]
MKKHKGLELYFNLKLAPKFAEREQNEKNFKVAKLIDRLIIHQINNFKQPIYAAELGGGAHPERAIVFTQLPNWTYLKEKYKREGKEIPVDGPGIKIFKNGVNYFK